MTGRRYFGSVRMRESGRWQIRYQGRDGRRVSYPRTFAKRSEAARVLSELERQSQAGTLLDPTGSRLTLGEYALRWVSQHPGLRPRTVEVYESLLRRHILPGLGSVTLGSLDTSVIRAWRESLLSSGVSRTMAAKSYRLLRAVLNTAVSEDSLIPANPCRIKGAGEERADERPVLSLGQVFELADAVPPRWRAFILLKTFASLRWGEITALTRADLDLARCTVRVRRQFVTVKGGIEAGPPKSRAGARVVSFPPMLLDELRHHLETYAGTGHDGLVFPNEHGEPQRRGTFNQVVPWDRVRRSLGVPFLHLHDLRHTGNTLAAQSGASLRDLMVRMGHDSPAAALIYQHPSRAADEAIARSLDESLRAYQGVSAGQRDDSGGPAEGPDGAVAKRSVYSGQAEQRAD